MRRQLGRLASRSGGFRPVGQATETIMGKKIKINYTVYNRVAPRGADERGV